VRGVRFLGDRRLTVETVDDPTPGTGEVVIAMRAAGLCGSDLRVFRSSAVGGEIAEAIVGHEPCGVGVAVGEASAAIGRERASSFPDQVLADIDADGARCR
jgi:threonine dehydrogenase-like Zn-dependent dehydrogenase